MVNASLPCYGSNCMVEFGRFPAPTKMSVDKGGFIFTNAPFDNMNLAIVNRSPQIRQTKQEETC